MPRYFFDTRDGSKFIRDEEGQELVGIEAAREEVTWGLADLPGMPYPARRAESLPLRSVTEPIGSLSGLLFGSRLMCSRIRSIRPRRQR
jgi:Domain of unknown function (DUF6894)